MTLHGVKSFDRVLAAMPMCGEILKGEVRPLTPYITGTLRRGVSTKFWRDGRWKIWLVGYGTAFYTTYIELGTKYITPRRMFARGAEAAHPKIEQYLKGIGAM